MRDLYFPGLETGPRWLHPYFGDFVGMVPLCSALHRKSHLLPSGEKPEMSCISQAARQETKLLSSLSPYSRVKLVYPALRCGCVGVRESTGVCLEPPSPIPIAAGCSLCQLPPGLSSPTLSTSSSSTGAFSLCEGGKSCATNRASEGKIWKGQFY